MNGSNPEYKPSTSYNDRIEGVFICPFVVALAFVFLADKLRIPNQLMAMVYGAAIGTCYAFIPILQDLQSLFWKPDAILLLCHPIMIVKVAYTLDIYVFVRSIWQIIILASMGTGMFIMAFGFLIIIMTNQGVSLVNIIAAGTSLAAIDVPEILMELNRIKNLEIIMDGESIFGSALCFMTFTFCQGAYEQLITEWYHVVCLYIRFIVLAYIIGICVGKVVAQIILFSYHDYMNVVLTILATTYGAYYVCEQYVGCSATICTFLIAYTIAKVRSKLSPSVDVKVYSFLDNAYTAVELLNCIILSAYVTYRMVKIYKGFDFAVAIGVYILGNVLRIFILLLLSPILSRLGMGFNFTTLFTIFWAAKRGSLQLLQVIIIAHLNMTNVLGTELLCFTLSYLGLSFIINMTSLRSILNYFGLIQFTNSRKKNITACITLLLQKKNRILFALKTNRLYSDLNWTLINQATSIDNTFANVQAVKDRVSNEFETHCPLCFRAIPYLSSFHEMQDLTRYIKSKMLKRQRISLVRQYEMGLLGKLDLEILLQCIDNAVRTESLNFPINYFIELFKTEKMTELWKRKLEKFKLKEYPLARRKFWHNRLFVMKAKWYICIKVLMLLSNISLIIAWIITHFGDYKCQDILLWTGYATSLFFIFDKFLLVASYRNKALGIIYTKLVWKQLGLCFSILDILAFCASAFFSFHYLRCACLIRIVTIYKCIGKASPYIIKYLDRKLDWKLYIAYKLSLAMVLSMENVQADLYSICKHEEVRELVGSQLQVEKLLLMEKLALMLHHRPNICVTVGTQQIKSAIMKALATTMAEINTAGQIESFEYSQIQKIIGNRLKSICLTSIYLQPNSAKSLIAEIPWMNTDEELLSFIYSKITMRIWEPGDIICQEGKFLEGIILFTEGLIKMTYVPDEIALNEVYNKGRLPIKELLVNTHFEQPEEDYLFMGNTIGEFAFLTKRPYNCKVEVIRSTCGLIIINSVLEKAMELSSDPVRGLECRLWKHVSNQILYQMIMERTHYQGLSVSKLQAVLNSAFLPKISNYKNLHVSNVIEDIFLLDGMIVDNSSREIYTAPCYIPRSIYNILLPKEEDDIRTRTRIIIIPDPNISPHRVMEITERLSGLVENPAPAELIHNTEIRRVMRGHILAETNPQNFKTRMKQTTVERSSTEFN